MKEVICLCNKSALFYNLPGIVAKGINAESDHDFGCQQIYRHTTVMIRKTLLPDLESVYNTTLRGTPTPRNVNVDLSKLDNGEYVLVQQRVRDGCSMTKKLIN